MSSNTPRDTHLEGLNKTYRSRAQTTRALDQFSLTIPAGEIFALLGPAGCGKSTLLRCIAGLETPETGEIRIGDETLWVAGQKHPLSIEKRDLGLVLQPPMLWPNKSVFDNVAFTLRMRKVGRAEIQTEVMQMLELVGLQRTDREAVKNMSAEQQWFVALASALVGKPKLILLDDPLVTLDAEARVAPRRRLRRCLQTLQTTALLATRSCADALACADRMAVMLRGRVVETGTPPQLYFNAREPRVAGYLSGANQFEAVIRGIEQEFLLVRSPLGTLHCQTRDLTEGTTGVVSILPEFIRVTRPESGPGFNVLEGHVHFMEFAGEFFNAEIMVHDQMLRARIAPDLGITVGDLVEVRLNPTHCRFLDA